jgi:UDP-sugar transporter A1/2/3
MYSQPERKRARPPPITIASYEKTAVVAASAGAGASASNTAYADNAADSGTTLTGYSDSMDRLAVPLDSVAAVGLSSSSRPASPLAFHGRSPSARGKRAGE